MVCAGLLAVQYPELSNEAAAVSAFSHAQVCASQLIYIYIWWKKEIAYSSELSFLCACTQCADPCEPLLWIGMVHYYHYQYYSHNYYYHIAFTFVIIITIIIFIVLHMLT